MSVPVFVDTSALDAILDAADELHDRAAAGWRAMLDAMQRREVTGVTHGSVIVESTALVQRRLGVDATRALLHDIVALLEVEWVDGPLHDRATTALVAARRRDVSLVDWTSFEVMRRHAIDTAFAFDDHFTEQGFTAWAS